MPSTCPSTTVRIQALARVDTVPTHGPYGLGDEMEKNHTIKTSHLSKGCEWAVRENCLLGREKHPETEISKKWRSQDHRTGR